MWITLVIAHIIYYVKCRPVEVVLLRSSVVLLPKPVDSTRRNQVYYAIGGRVRPALSSRGFEVAVQLGFLVKKRLTFIRVEAILYITVRAKRTTP